MDRKLLDSDETIELRERPNALRTFFGMRINSILIITVVVYTIFVVKKYVPLYGIFIFLLLLIAMYLISFLKCLFTSYTFTDRRLLIERGVVFKQYINIKYNKITDNDLNRGPIDYMCNTGTISVYTADDSNDKNIVLQNVKNYTKIISFLSNS